MNHQVHIFEAAGLGKGPFHLSHVTDGEGGNCQFCNTAIRYRFYIKGQDKRVFFVGSDCVMKTGDNGLMQVVAEEVKRRMKEARQERNRKAAEDLKGFLADPEVRANLMSQKHPHPYYAGQGLSMYDYAMFCATKGGPNAWKRVVKMIAE